MQISKTKTIPKLIDANLASKTIQTDSSEDATYEDAMEAFTITEDQYDSAFRELAK
jgi:hypothetical protein